MDINRDDLKKPEFWAIVSPAALLLIGLIVMFNMHSVRADSESKLRTAKKVVTNAKELLQITKKSGFDLMTESNLEDFETLTSMMKCATAAKIPDGNIQHIAGEKPKKQRDGKMLYRERFELHNVRMEQIGLFVDYAENNYNSLSCNSISITPFSNKSNKDRWNTTVQFEHVK